MSQSGIMEHLKCVCKVQVSFQKAVQQFKKQFIYLYSQGAWKTWTFFNINQPFIPLHEGDGDKDGKYVKSIWSNTIWARQVCLSVSLKY